MSITEEDDTAIVEHIDICEGSLSPSAQFFCENAVIDTIQEEDPDEVYIKEEIIVKEEETVSVPVVNSPRLEDMLICNKKPIVYTTRLDEMLIFNKNFEQLDVAEIFENILYESKPTFLTCIKHPVQKNHIINPFYKLVKHITEINERAMKTTIDFNEDNADFCLNEQSKQLLAMCTPVYIVLIDCKVPKDCTVIVSTITDENMKASWTVQSSEPRISIRSRPLGKKTRLKRGRYNCIVFTNVANKTTDMYFINRNTCASIYVCLDHVAQQDEIPLASVKLKNCCWIARDNSISNIVGWPAKNKVASRFMGKPHECPLGQCFCCCNTKYNESICDVIPLTSDKSSTTRVRDRLTRIPALSGYEKSRWLINLQSPQLIDDSNSYVNQALKYTKSKQERNWKPAEGNEVTPRHFQLNINNKQANETYYVGKNGTIVKHIAVKKTELADNEKDSNDICCWFKQDWLVRNSNSLIQSKQFHTVKCFMRTPHTCSENACLCCCRTKMLGKKRDSGQSTDIVCPKYAKNYSNKTFKCLKMINKYSKKAKVLSKPIQLPLAVILPTVAPPQTLTKSSVQTSADAMALNKVSLTPSPVWAQKQASTQTEKSQKRKNPSLIKKPETLPPEPAKVLPKQGGVTNLTEQSSQSKTSLPGISLDTENDDPAVNSLVQSILGRFKDVKLTITPDGDVSAELNTPIQNLSTAELKILSAILAHAKEEVKALKSQSSVNIANLNAFRPNAPIVAPGLLLPNTSIANPPLPGLIYYPITPNPLINSSAPGPSFPPVPNPSIPTTSAAKPSNMLVGNWNTSVAGPSNAPFITVNPLITNKPAPPGMLTANVSTFKRPLAETVARRRREISDTPKESAYECYSNISGLKVQQYIASCKTFLKGEKQQFSNPKIKNVISLSTSKDDQTKNMQKQVIPQPGTSGVKRKAPLTTNNEEKTKRTKSNKGKPPNSLHREPNTLEQPLIIATPPSNAIIYPVVACSQPTDQVVKSAGILHNLINRPSRPPFTPMNLDPSLFAIPSGVKDLDANPHMSPVVGPAYSLAENNEVDSETTDEIVIDKIEIDEDCILGV